MGMLDLFAFASPGGLAPSLMGSQTSPCGGVEVDSFGALVHRYQNTTAVKETVRA